MSQYDPAHLSPLPIEANPRHLPYDLTWEDLLPALPGFDLQVQESAQAFASYEKQGLNGGENSQILTIRYSTSSGQFLSETVFVKQSANPLHQEALKYRFLAERGVATPQLLLAVEKGEFEVFLLEFLPAIGINFSSPCEVTSLLHLLVDLNSIHELPGYIKPGPDGMPQDEFDRGVLTALEEIARDQPERQIDVLRWFQAYQAAHQAREEMPLALTHQEFAFQQVGWAQRGKDRQLVVFDLETMGLSPRFNDVTAILYPLSLFTGQDQSSLFQIYLDRLNQKSGTALSFEDAFHEFRLLRVAETCYGIPWLLSEVRQPDNYSMDWQAELSMAVDCLHDDLAYLGVF